MTKKAVAATRSFGAQKNSKNGYILFKAPESVEPALKMNGSSIGKNHLRVDRVGDDRKLDFESTIFIGNCPFIVDEEDIRIHIMQTMGEVQIENIRVIRNNATQIGKGIAYVTFSDKETMREGITKLNKSTLKYRELRVKKAVEPKRLEKKQKKKLERMQKSTITTEGGKLADQARLV